MPSRREGRPRSPALPIPLCRNTTGVPVPCSSTFTSRPSGVRNDVADANQPPSFPPRTGSGSVIADRYPEQRMRIQLIWPSVWS